MRPLPSSCPIRAAPNRASTTPHRGKHRRPGRPDHRRGGDPDRDQQHGRVRPCPRSSLWPPSSAYQIGTPSSTAVTITSSVVPMLTIVANMSTIPQGGAAILHHHRQPGTGEEHLGQLCRRRHGPARPELRAARRRRPASRRADPGHRGSAVPPDQHRLRTDRHDRRHLADPGRAGLSSRRGHRGARGSDPDADRAEPDRHPAGLGRRPERAQAWVSPARCRSPARTTRGTASSPSSTSTPREISSGSRAQSSQVYEGQIEVSDLTGADGSQVSINVVTQEVDNALTVPIAAVKQNGSGADVVRVIDLHQGGQDHRGAGDNRPHRRLLHPDHRGTADRTAGDRRKSST